MRIFISTLSVAAMLGACSFTVSTDIEDPEDTNEPGAPVENGVKKGLDKDDASPAADEGLGGAFGIGTEGDEDSASVRVINVTAQNWEFTPSTITAKKGEKVTLSISGLSGTHGFAVPELGINVAVAAGKTVEVDLPTDTPGTYSLLCSIPCGSGHSGMTGKVVISE